MELTTRKLPTISELQQDIQTAFAQDKLNLLLNQPVPKAWIVKNKYVSVRDENGKMVPAEYLPVDKVEYLLLRIFGRWRREIKIVTMVGNSVMAIVRVHVLNPVTNEWDFHDGVGAVAIQQDAGASQTDVEAIKKNAFQIGAPAAVSFALKDAAECFGTIFGKDLNKPKAITFTGSIDPYMVEYKDKQLPPTNGQPPVINMPPVEGML